VVAILLAVGCWWMYGAPVSGRQAHIPSPADPPALKVLTWNIRVGRDQGLNKNAWPRRKHLFRQVLQAEKPAIFCAQEALQGQLAYLQEALPHHGRVGVGRDDGKAEGEHCAIFYDRRRLKLVQSGSFWLSETPEQPSSTWNRRGARWKIWSWSPQRLVRSRN